VVKMNTTTGNSFTPTATTTRRAANIGPLSTGSDDNSQSREEPDEGSLSRPVLNQRWEP
jgi:hypothetical protein